MVKYLLILMFYVNINMLDSIKETTMMISKTNRGFSITDFKDVTGHECSLQISSCVSEKRIFLGLRDTEEAHFKVDLNKFKTRSQNGTLTFNRIILSRKQVINLLSYLTEFAETGKLSCGMGDLY